MLVVMVRVAVTFGCRSAVLRSALACRRTGAVVLAMFVMDRWLCKMVAVSIRPS